MLRWLMLVAKLCPTLCNCMDCIAHQAALSMGFPKQEYSSGWPFPSTGDLPPSRDQIQVSCIAGRFFTIWATREALNVPTIVKKLILKLAFNMYYFSKHTFSGGTFLTKHLFYILKEQKIVNQRHYKRSMSVF